MRYCVLYFSPTGGVRRVSELLTQTISPEWTFIDLSLTLNGQHDVTFSEEDVCVIAMPSYGGRAPEVAVERLAKIQGGGARAILLSVYGNRNDEDTLFELRNTARAAGFACIAAVRAIAQHSILPSIGAGRPDAQDAQVLADFGRTLGALLESGTRACVDLPEKERLRPFGGLMLKPKTNGRCIGCGKCATLCPVHAIPSDDPALTDANLCITCMRCVHVCPQHARRLSPLMIALVGRKLKRACAVRREPELILGANTSDGRA